MEVDLTKITITFTNTAAGATRRFDLPAVYRTKPVYVFARMGKEGDSVEIIA